ncbi:MAG: hypothetical protein GY737_27445 [Desulfobacteraceae bacterium]|nr:hypothetical protein [Desulfobacteraceae bacterium]
MAGLCGTSLYSYLLFHSLSELFSIVVAFGIFMVVWNSRRFLDNNYMRFLGIAYLFIGSIDLVHTLAYKGMGIFTGYGANLPTQMWIAARYMESISLLIAPFLFGRKIRISQLFSGYFAITSLIFLSIFTLNVFPDCFIEGQGLTIFKKVSEYIISLLLAGSMAALRFKRNEFDPYVFKLLIASILITIGAELAFTFYVSVYGLSNFVGHFFKLISFFLIYKAIIETGLRQPYNLLFRNVEKRKKELKEERDRLKKALDEIVTLQGLLPICSVCKNIRDDKGYWNRIETYIEKHSDAEFSHGLCPSCSEKLYGKEGWYIRSKKKRGKEK